MRKYSIRDYAKPCKYVGRRRMCYYDWFDTLADETTPITTSFNNVVFDDINNGYNTFRSIKYVSNSAELIMLKIRVYNRKRSLRDLV